MPPRREVVDASRLANLRATLAFLRLPPTEPELVALHRCFDSWSGLGQIAVGLARQGYWLSLTHIADREWRCYLMGDNLMLAPKGFGVATTPWGAVQMAGWAAITPRRPASE
jgi:hypothetical protein